MHNSVNVLKDLNNSIKFTNKDGLIIIDDILPLNEDEQLIIPKNHYYENNILKYNNQSWTGDEGKVIYELLLNYSDNIKQYNYYEYNNYRGILYKNKKIYN